MSPIVSSDKESESGSFIRIYLRDGSAHFAFIGAEHLTVFGIDPKLTRSLHHAWLSCREIEQEDGVELSWVDRAEAVYRANEGNTQLPFNQCVRWEMLTAILAELHELKTRFGLYEAQNHGPRHER